MKTYRYWQCPNFSGCSILVFEIEPMEAARCPKCGWFCTPSNVRMRLMSQMAARIMRSGPKVEA